MISELRSQGPHFLLFRAVFRLETKIEISSLFSSINERSLPLLHHSFLFISRKQINVSLSSFRQTFILWIKSLRLSAAWASP